MFTSFSVAGNTMGDERPARPSATSQTRTRRKPVSIACENCRKDRTKCDSQTPCRHCRHKNLECTRLDGANVPGLIQQIQHLVGKVHDLEGRVQQTLSPAPTPSTKITESPTTVGLSDVRPIPASTDNSRVGAPAPSFGASSPLLDLSAERFATRLETLLGQERYQAGTRGRITFSLDVNPPLSQSQNVPTSLPKNLQDYYIRLYWQRIHRTLPVIDRATFDTHYELLWDRTHDIRTRPNSHMVDIVIALALQLEYSSKPQDPWLEGVGSPSGSRQHEILRHTAGVFYEACAGALSEGFESPSLSILQSYILMVVYLRNEQRHNSAYQILGFAIRAANILRLHERPRNATPREELSIRDQIADFLFCFDVQQYLEFGRPYGIPDPSTKRHVPLGDSDMRCFWSYYSELLSIAKIAHFTVGHNTQHHDVGNPQSAGMLAQMALSVPQTINDIAVWAQRVPAKFLFERHFPASPFCTEAPAEMNVDLPLWKFRQCLLLELSHHWILMGILRWFILPESDSMSEAQVSARNSFSTYAQRAVEHSIAIIEVIQHAHSETEAIPGWQDSHIIQWDASLTLLSFITCQPSAPLTTRASSALAKSHSIFSALGTAFTNAAATNIQNLLASTHKQSAQANSSGSSSRSGTARSPSSVPELFDKSFDFSGDFLVDESLGAFDLPMDLEFMAMQRPEFSSNSLT